MQRQRLSAAYLQAATGSSTSSSSSSSSGGGTAGQAGGPPLQQQQLGRFLALLLPGAGPKEVAELVGWVEGGVPPAIWDGEGEVLEALQSALTARESGNVEEGKGGIREGAEDGLH